MDALVFDILLHVQASAQLCCRCCTNEDYTIEQHLVQGYVQESAKVCMSLITHLYCRNLGTTDTNAVITIDKGADTNAVKYGTNSFCIYLHECSWLAVAHNLIQLSGN
jgi:hypothetical protein